ncbi:UvrD-helicase domain-containing protein [Oceanobacillus sp. CFH 90083]|uniref:UvrD-helicase domain-containing protein n=1 Tax=Oceanobacillus sp. CFH 90083 TaxID=2592336 RepID=UPI00128E3F49|nr:ATP-dependent helicase [Oceanobacillus sp. CFH 90083]
MNLISSWQPTDGLDMEGNAFQSIKHSNNVLVVAGPGAGKTELLAQKANYLLTTGLCSDPKKILAVSFKKDAAENLAERVKKRIPKNKELLFVSMTFDSFSKSILDRFLFALPSEWRPKEDYEVDTNLNGLTQAFAEVGVNLTSKKQKYLKENQMVSDSLPIENEQLAIIWKKMLKGNSIGKSYLTFKMISRLVILLLKNNPHLLNALRKTYEYIFLDEFQDTTYLQYELFNVCFYASGSLITAVGDDRQKIMTWAGAMENAFERFIKNYKAASFTLFMNHRSAPKLLAIQEVVNNYLSDEYFSPVPNDAWEADDGHAEIWYLKNDIIEAKKIAVKITELLKTGIEQSDICILVKQLSQNYAEVLVPVLGQYNILARDESFYQDLLKEKITEIIISTLRASLNSRDADSWLNVINTKMMFMGENHYVNSNEIEDLTDKTKMFLRNIKSKLDLATEITDLVEIFQSIILYYGIENFQATFLEYRNISYFESLVEKILDSMFEYFLEYKDWNLVIDYFEGKNSVPIMTIHKSKGLEFNTVFLIGLDDSAFWSYEYDKQETTSTFFVAISRAKERLFFTYSEIRNNQYCQREIIEPFYKVLKESNVVDEKYY